MFFELTRKETEVKMEYRDKCQKSDARHINDIVGVLLYVVSSVGSFFRLNEQLPSKLASNNLLSHSYF